jgi:hypothetical protein
MTRIGHSGQPPSATSGSAGRETVNAPQRTERPLLGSPDGPAYDRDEAQSRYQPAPANDCSGSTTLFPNDLVGSKLAEQLRRNERQVPGPNRSQAAKVRPIPGQLPHPGPRHPILLAAAPERSEPKGGHVVAERRAFGQLRRRPRDVIH